MDFPLPKIGKWYKLENGEIFEVVAIDEHDRTVEIQYFDGAVDEFDYHSWSISRIINSNPPEDWSGAYDMLPEDYGVDREQYIKTYRGNQLDCFE